MLNRYSQATSSYDATIPLLMISLWLSHTASAAQTGSTRTDDIAVETAARYGPQDYRLAEQFLGLGIQQYQRGELDAAADSLSQALHIGRIHQGLHHQNHLPIIDLLIDVHRARGAWPAVEQNFALSRWMAERELTDDDEQLIAVLRRDVSWQLLATRLPTKKPPDVHLQQARDSIDKALRAAARLFGGKDPRQSELLYQAAHVDFAIASYVALTPHETRTSADPFFQDDFYTEEVMRRRKIFFESYNRGRTRLLRAIEIHQQSGDAEQLANAHAYFGDWQLLFGRSRGASESYHNAYQTLAAVDVTKAASYFERPRLLPLFPNPSPFTAASDRRERGGAGARLALIEVNAKGLVRKIEQNQHSTGRALRSYLRASRFRPRLVDGKPVATAGVEFRYSVPTGNE